MRTSTRGEGIAKYYLGNNTNEVVTFLITRPTEAKWNKYEYQ